MKVVIPLAGFGTRLRPHTYSRPKPLLNVAGKPVLAHILDKFTPLDPEEVVFIVGHLGKQIEEYVGAHYRFPAQYVVQEQLLGQAHALWLAREHIQGPIAIVFVDTLFEADLGIIERETADGIAFVKEVEDPRRFGVAVLDGAGYVQQLIEKPQSMEHRLAVIGLYYLRDGAHLVNAIERLMAAGRQTKGEYYLTDAIQLMIDDGARIRTETVDVWQDCGVPEAVLDTNRYLLDHGHHAVESEALEHALIVPPVYIAPTARVRRSIVGPHVTLGDEVVVEDAIVSDSILEEGAVLADSIIEGSLVGPRVEIHGSRQRLNIGETSQVEQVPPPAKEG